MAYVALIIREYITFLLVCTKNLIYQKRKCFDFTKNQKTVSFFIAITNKPLNWPSQVMLFIATRLTTHSVKQRNSPCILNVHSKRPIKLSWQDLQKAHQNEVYMFYYLTMIQSSPEIYIKMLKTFIHLRFSAQ